MGGKSLLFNLSRILLIFWDNLEHLAFCFSWILEGSGKDVFAGTQMDTRVSSGMHGFACRDSLMFV